MQQRQRHLEFVQLHLRPEHLQDFFERVRQVAVFVQRLSKCAGQRAVALRQAHLRQLTHQMFTQGDGGGRLPFRRVVIVTVTRRGRWRAAGRRFAFGPIRRRVRTLRAERIGQRLGHWLLRAAKGHRVIIAL